MEAASLEHPPPGKPLALWGTGPWEAHNPGFWVPSDQFSPQSGRFRSCAAFGDGGEGGLQHCPPHNSNLPTPNEHRLNASKDKAVSYGPLAPTAFLQ